MNKYDTPLSQESILICVPGRDVSRFQSALSEALPAARIRVWQEGMAISDVTWVVAWQAPNDIWQQMPQLKAIASFGAGVDHLLAKEVPDVPITRVVDPALAKDMANYVASHCLAYQNRILEYRAKQAERTWKPRRARRLEKALILGAGHLGEHTGKVLQGLGFEVTCFARTEKKRAFPTIKCRERLLETLNTFDVVVCLLPLTSHTRHFIDAEFLKSMKADALLINVGRGQHLDEAALIPALAKEQLGFAVLDVFAREPLDEAHEFWHHPQIAVTPHVSALTSIGTITAQIAENVRALSSGEPLRHTIDKGQEY